MTAESYELSASLEDYLEALYEIESEKHAAKARDVKNRLGVSPSSVTGALHALADRGLINYAPYDLITLTESGREAALEVTRRHQALQRFFMEVLGVEREEASAVACEMEHSVSENVLEQLLRFLEFLRVCPRAGEDWLRRFRECDAVTVSAEVCDQCLDEQVCGEPGDDE